MYYVKSVHLNSVTTRGVFSLRLVMANINITVNNTLQR